MTLSGLLDVSYHTISGNGTTASTKLNSVSTSVGSATSAINLNVVEDLGGGLKAQAFYALILVPTSTTVLPKSVVTKLMLA